MGDRNRVLEYVLNGLMQRYQQRVPAVSKILGALVNQGVIADSSAIENDHIAFRTLGLPQLGIQSLERIFINQGYVRKDYYRFEAKKLNAYWYSPPLEKYPRIFISELRVPELSTLAQKTILKYTRAITEDPVLSLDLSDGSCVDRFLHTALWPVPQWDEYQALLNESEYAAWTIYNRYYLNHFTVGVHNLPQGYDTIENFNTFVESLGIVLNDSGGKIKVSPDGLLRQSSTVAEMVDAEFSGNAESKIHKISGSYVEFAERRALPQFQSLPKSELRRQHRREGFEANNADKIFESTYSSQTKRIE